MKKYKKLLIVLVIIALLLPTFTITNGLISTNDVTAAKDMSIEDKRIAEDISNMTGVKIDEIVEQKNQGATWNEVLDKLKKVDYTNQNERDARNTVLATTGVDSELVKRLKSEGFKDDEINEAKMLIDRVTLQLSEIITSQDGNDQQLRSVSTDIDTQTEEDITQYAELSDKIDTNTALYLILKLSKDFITKENVLDEYLLSLQIGVNFEDYIVDKKTYETEKNEKMISADLQKIITIAKIEETLLKLIQQRSVKDKNNDDLESGSENESDISNPDIISQELPIPYVGEARPQSPTEDVMKEVNEIIDKSLNIEPIGEGVMKTHE